MKIFQSSYSIMRRSYFEAMHAKGMPDGEWPNSGEYSYHDFFECELFLEGEGYHYINFEDRIIKKGLVYILEPMDCHKYEAKRSLPLELYNLKFTEEMVSPGVFQLLKTRSKPYVIYATGELFDGLKHDMEELIYLEHALDTDKLNQDLTLLLAKNVIERFILRLVQNMSISTVVENAETPNQQMQKIVKWIDDHYQEKILMSDAAKAISLSPKYFGTLFKKFMNMGFTDYLFRVRTIHAKKLILTTNMSFKEISYRCGFASNAHFTRVFKKWVGMTPKEFRANRL